MGRRTYQKVSLMMHFFCFEKIHYEAICFFLHFPSFCKKYKKQDQNLTILSLDRFFILTKTLLYSPQKENKIKIPFPQYIKCVLKYKEYLKGNARNFHKYLIKYYTETFLLKYPFFLCFQLICFCCFLFKHTPSCSFKYLKTWDINVVKKKSFLNVY